MRHQLSGEDLFGPGSNSLYQIQEHTIKLIAQLIIMHILIVQVIAMHIQHLLLIQVKLQLVLMRQTGHLEEFT